MSARERPRFMDHVSPANQRLLRAIPPHLLKQAEEGLNSVRRGQGNKRLEPYNNEFYETDLGHTIDMLDLAEEISTRFPNITRGIDRDALQRMIMVHDLGEVDPRIGDVPFCGPERDSPIGLRKKALEPYAAVRILRRIPKPEIREPFMQAYRQYDRRNLRDPLAQLVKLADTIQGTTRAGLDGIFARYRDFGLDIPPQSLQEHIEQSLPKMMSPALNLARLLEKPGRAELDELIDEELQRLQIAGYEELARFADLLYSPLILYPY